MRDQLTTAIEQRRIVTFTYDGHLRRVQPAALGIGKRKGRETLHAYQVDGGSNGDIPDWRNFSLERIQSLAVLDEVFGPTPPGFNPRPFPNTIVALNGPSAGTTTGAGPAAAANGGGSGGGQQQPSQPQQKDQVIPGVPITSEQAAKAAEQAAKAAEQAGKAISGAAEALGKWFRKKR